MRDVVPVMKDADSDLVCQTVWTARRTLDQLRKTDPESRSDVEIEVLLAKVRPLSTATSALASRDRTLCWLATGLTSAMYRLYDEVTRRKSHPATA